MGLHCGWAGMLSISTATETNLTRRVGSMATGTAPADGNDVSDCAYIFEWASSFTRVPALPGLPGDHGGAGGGEAVEVVHCRECGKVLRRRSRLTEWQQGQALALRWAADQLDRTPPS